MKVVLIVDMPDDQDVETNLREVLDEVNKTRLYVKDYELNKFPHLSTRVFCSATADVSHPSLVGGLNG